MKILMCTNTYLPHVGGVAKSVATFVREYRELGHEVLVIAPEFDGNPETDPGVVRVAAIQNFNGSDFSVRLPIPLTLKSEIRDFDPDIVHSHHPFLLGTNAAHIAALNGTPLVFTHHTLYERYTHYVPGDSELMQRYAIELAVGYCNLCAGVIAPSGSIADLLRERGVTVPMVDIPTGVDVDAYKDGDGQAVCAKHGLEETDFVVGHVGRLAPEKNLEFLGEAVADFISQHGGRFLLVGEGPSQEHVESTFHEKRLDDHLIATGALTGQDLIDAYHAMDVFAFASQTETQGMVLLEAMAAGVPVVAVDATGVRDVVDEHNGVLLKEEDHEAFVKALAALANDRNRWGACAEHAARTAQEFSQRNCAISALDFYQELIKSGAQADSETETALDDIMNLLESEWELWSNRAAAAVEAIGGEISS